MTWIPCNRCPAAPCICEWRSEPYHPYTPLPSPPQVMPFTFTPSISDADVERIAKRVAELLSGFSRVTRTVRPDIALEDER